MLLSMKHAVQSTQRAEEGAEHADARPVAFPPQIEAAWAGLPRNEQERIFTELQELQKKDWKELSLDEKKAGGFAVAYGAARSH